MHGFHIEWGTLVCAIVVVVVVVVIGSGGGGELFKYSSVVHFVCVFYKCTVCCLLFFAFVRCAVAAVVIHSFIYIHLAVDSACL